MTTTPNQLSAILKATMVAAIRKAMPDDTADLSDDEIWDTTREQPADVDFVLICANAIAGVIGELDERLRSVEARLTGNA